MVELILGTVTAMLEVVGGALELTVTEAEISVSDDKALPVPHHQENSSRNRFLRIFPIAFLGSRSRKCTAFGNL